MAKHYVYTMDHDTGFAPNVDHDICTLCGCKRTTIEVWAQTGSWVMGIGGNGTGRPDKLVYSMQVEVTAPYLQFKRKFPSESEYLKAWANERSENRSFLEKNPTVLWSKKYYYFGDRAIDLPVELHHIIWRRQGCKCVSDKDAARLADYLVRAGYGYGKHGNPNNPPPSNKKKCCNP